MLCLLKVVVHVGGTLSGNLTWQKSGRSIPFTCTAGIGRVLLGILCGGCIGDAQEAIKYGPLHSMFVCEFVLCVCRSAGLSVYVCAISSCVSMCQS